MKSTVDGGGRTDYNLTLEVSTDRQTKVVVKKADETQFNAEDSIIATLKTIFENDKDDTSADNRVFTIMIS